MMNRAMICSVILHLAICGCGPRDPILGPVDKTRDNLQAIGGAYVAATLKADKAPAKLEDLLPFLGDSSVTEEQKRAMFRSPSDGEDFVVAWGVDFRKLGEAGASKDVIFVYEKRGKGGQRYVLKLPSDIFIIPDDVFQKSQFPKGHEPGS